MKCNAIPTIIAVALSALMAYVLYNWCKMTDANLLVSIVGGVTLCCTLVTTLGISIERSRTSANIKVISSLTVGGMTLNLGGKVTDEEKKTLLDWTHKVVDNIQ